MCEALDLVISTSNNNSINKYNKSQVGVWQGWVWGGGRRLQDWIITAPYVQVSFSGDECSGTRQIVVTFNTVICKCTK
jgi:hypothetical protein